MCDGAATRVSLFINSDECNYARPTSPALRCSWLESCSSGSTPAGDVGGEFAAGIPPRHRGCTDHEHGPCSRGAGAPSTSSQLMAAARSVGLTSGGAAGATRPQAQPWPAESQQGRARGPPLLLSSSRMSSGLVSQSKPHSKHRSPCGVASHPTMVTDGLRTSTACGWFVCPTLSRVSSGHGEVHEHG